MKQRMMIFLLCGLMLIVLIGLNAATYTQKEKTPDNEFAPNRSSYNSGATGSQAFYSLLAESGQNVTRWQQPLSELRSSGKNNPGVFVLIGKPRRELADSEFKPLLEWVKSGGRLVLIDREPPSMLLAADPWTLKTVGADDPGALTIDPTDVHQMTEGIAAARPLQPTAYTDSVIAVQPSRLASKLVLERKSFPNNAEDDQTDSGNNNKKYTVSGSRSFQGSGTSSAQPPPPPKATSKAVVDGPVVHIAAGGTYILADVPYGSGSIVLLSDPYIVSNTGIGLVDNGRLAVNLVSGSSGAIAFDEYHQGYGSNNNRLFQYFQGTPVVAIFLQLAMLVGLILFSQSRRFAMALPENEPNRLSKLEYVGAMAELQQRSRAYDLAIENIYGDFRRRLARLVGADAMRITYRELARLAAERSKMPVAEIEDLFFRCEDAIRGEPIDRARTLELIARVRSAESLLGMTRVSRSKI